MLCMHTIFLSILAKPINKKISNEDISLHQ